MMLRILIFSAILIYSGVESQQDDRCRGADNEEVTSCQECLWTKDCEWCTEKDTNLSGSPPGADMSGVVKGCVKKGTCPKQKVKKSDVPKQNEDRDVRIKRKIGQDRSQRQLSPHQLDQTVITNPTQEAEVLFRITPKTEHPVDLYFIMDLSKSMETYKTSLENVAKSVKETIEKETTKFRMGFGSFSDKPTAPFAAELSFYTGTRKAPYAYHHVQNLTTNSADFIKSVQAQDLRGNVDSPESGMDALMQAIVCEELIWKTDKSKNDTARKIIIFVTDQSSHYALDGLLGGIVTPADEQCHMTFCGQGNNKNLEGCAGSVNVFSYEDQLKRDYPSFGQIRKVINEKNMNVIFAVTEFMHPIYEKLADFLGQKGNVGKLPKGDSVASDDGMKKLIVDQYKKIRGKVRVTTVGNDDLTMFFQQMSKGGKSQSVTSKEDKKFDCPPGKTQKQEFECTGVPAKGQHEIWGKAFIDITKEKCKSLNGAERSEKIKLFGDSQDTLSFKYKCENCDSCTVSGQSKPNDPRCHGNGTFICGGCLCNDDRKGRFCQCDTKNSDSVDIANCRRNSNSEICSGRGNCNCGSCECQSGYTGRCCQINALSKCGGDNDEVCSGNGKCVESGSRCENEAKCECNKGYEGLNCKCCKSGDCKKNCFDRFSDTTDNSQMCSGHGTCDCEGGRNGQKCKCDPGWGGEFCQKNENKEQTCKLLEPCVNYRLSYDPANPNSEMENECKNNLAKIGYKGDKAKGIGVEKTRIACQSSEGGTLSDSFQLLKSPKGENDVNYCDKVQAEVRKAQETSSDNDDGNSGQASNYASISQDDFTRCEMPSLADSNCQIRFYHNHIDDNKHFRHGDHVQEDKTFIYVVKHNGTEDGKWQYHVDCKSIPVMTILISTIGTFFAICLGLLISAVVIININDYRSYKKYLANKKEAEMMMNEMNENAQFVSPETTTSNPQHRKL